MLIKEFFLPQDEAAILGLKEVKMSRLGRFVAIAGKNGSGKSRLLKELNEIVLFRDEHIDKVFQWQSEAVSFQKQLLQNPKSSRVHEWEERLNNVEKNLILLLERVFPSVIDARFKSLGFVPKKLELKDTSKMGRKEMLHGYSAAKSAKLENFSAHCLAYIQQLQNRYWTTTHQHYVQADNDVSPMAATLEYEGLKEIIAVLMQDTILRTANDEATIFGKPFAEAGLSDGQIVILQLATALHAQSGTLDNTVFILDELENHLHPSVTIDIIEKISAVAPNAQFWIATHSIPLLAYIHSKDPMALWFMEDGHIRHAGKHPENVLKSLLGDDERIAQLNSFTGLPAQLAATNYAVESLRPPAVSGSGKGDPQVNQIASIIAGLRTTEPLRILDFGAGKGRLLEGLADAIENGKLSEQVSYIAFDEYPSDKNLCVKLIQEHFQDWANRYFSTSKEFFEGKDNQSIDVVVMCNVLHEIPPKEWLKQFSERSLIIRALADNGYLLLVEDQRIPVGEKAHEHGFLVLDTDQLKALFKVTEPDIKSNKFIVNDHRGDGRLKAHLISKELLQRIDADSRKLAITRLIEASKEQIKNIRASSPSYEKGQLNGFWTQQFTNASLYLEEIAGTS